MKQKVHILVLAGLEQDALAFAQRRYPQCDAALLSKTDFRESNVRGQLRRLRQLRGQALVIFTDSLRTVREPMLLKWTALVHRCRETVLADASGACEVSGGWRLVALVPLSLFAAAADLLLLAVSWVGLQLFRIYLALSRPPRAAQGELDLAFLHPSEGGLVPGGAQTHITGFLGGLEQEKARVVVLSGQPIQTAFEVRRIPGSRRLNLFREAAILAYNFPFIAAARHILKDLRPRLLYQRHGRFLFAGAFLSRLLGIPLVLEYNGSEVWIARHWDPIRFSAWLGLCERVSIRAASYVVVVSNALKHELMAAGVPEARIVINPNAVDPQAFTPGCGGARLRPELGLRPDDRVVGFVGTFSYWHGVEVLEQSIHALLSKPQPETGRLKFLLVGDGPLAARLRDGLEPYVRQGAVLFTGTVPHHQIRNYLDAADILVSPHVPMPGGRPFFGSPTKLFEYMAMGKPIVASALDQIGEILENERTALLVRPGDADPLTAAIERLASDPRLRGGLGHNARARVLTFHTWRQNARRVLGAVQQPAKPLSTAPHFGPGPSELFTAKKLHGNLQ